MKGGKNAKVLSIVLAAAMLCIALIPAKASGAAQKLRNEPELLAHYPFQDGGKDVSGNGNDAVIGAGVTVEDGVASLPGGTKDSTAYITLPKGMFDGQDELTVSMWLKDEDPQESWLGAFFFGSPANASHVPANYYYFVPCEKDAGTLKSVFTDSVNETSPNTTERGVAKSVNTTAYRGVWTHYAIVLKPGSMICYIDGKEVGQASLSRRVSDFGTGLEAYIGKSNYLNDPVYQGDFRDFRIYKNALDAEQVWKVMINGMEPADVLEMAAAKLSVPGLSGYVNKDFELPVKTFYDMVNISWTSSNESVMSNDGKVQAVEEDTKVVLTAALSYGGMTVEKKFAVLVCPSDRYPYSMEIDGAHVTKQLSDNLYGLFYEDINSAADGGLYPEMVKNYSFENAYVEAGDTGSDYFRENGYRTVGNYKLHWAASPASGFEVESGEGLNENNTHYAVLSGNVTLQNGGFAPQSYPNGAAMPVKPLSADKKTGTYTFSAFTRAERGYTGKLKVKIVNANGRQITDEQEIALEPDGTWKKVSAELTSAVNTNTKGKMVLTVEGASGAEELCMDMVSIVPHDSYGYGNRNYAYGAGVRQDLLDLMMDLNPKFMRFPGGCIVEGFNWEGLYDWRDSIGPLEERKSNTNRWENWNNQNRTWGYMQSYGFGYHELLSLCEDFGMEAFPILSAGVLCQYETNGVNAKTGKELTGFIEMATDLLDYCWGDAKTNEWAAKRAENGHPEPFDLKYLGIGNENFQAKYFDNLDVIKDAVEKYAKENYPDRELTVISSAGPTSAGDNLEYAYDRLGQTMAGETLVDEHYYETESFMYNQSDRYDYYQRTGQGGSSVFVGEYAVKNDNKYNTALAEAAYITGLERNADVVTNISYAPLLYKVGSLSWSHDLIYFDEFNTAKSTNYYVQQMFGQNYGTQLIGTELKALGKDYSNYGSPILGMNAGTGSIDKITVYDASGNVLLEDDFDDNSNGWERFGAAGSSGEFRISGGKLNFTGTDGMNAVYLPKAVDEKWSDFRIVVEGAVKTSGNDGFVVGAGHEKQYYWYHMGKNGKGTCMEVTRPNRGETVLITKELGNHYANRHYNQSGQTKLQTNDPMEILFNFGAGGKLEGSYTSRAVSRDRTAKCDFSSELNQYQTDIYQVVNKDDKNVYIKLVNPDNEKKTIQLCFDNLRLESDTEAEITMLTAELDDINQIEKETVVPVTSCQSISDSQMVYELPEYSVNVIRVPLAAEPEVSKTELEALITQNAKLKEADYTKESWAAYQQALVKAEEMLEQGGKYTDMKEVYELLRTALRNLKKAEQPTEKLTEKPVGISEVKLSTGKLALGVKEKVTLKVLSAPAGASEKITWKSSNKAVVTVTDGKIKGRKPGKAVITVTTAGGKSADCKVTVKKAPKKITLKTRTKTLKKGKTFRIKVKFPSGSCSYKLTYTSNKKKVAEVSPDGKVTAKKKGKAVITVRTFNNKKAKLTVRVR